MHSAIKYPKSLVIHTAFCLAIFFSDSYSFSIPLLNSDLRLNEILLLFISYCFFAYNPAILAIVLKPWLFLSLPFILLGCLGYFSFPDGFYSQNSIFLFFKTASIPVFLLLSSLIIVFAAKPNPSILLKAYINSATILSITIIIAGFLGWQVYSDGRFSFPLYEPSQLAVTIVPSLSISLYLKKYTSFLINIFAIVLAQSSLAYITCFIIIAANLLFIIIKKPLKTFFNSKNLLIILVLFIVVNFAFNTLLNSDLSQLRLGKIISEGYSLLYYTGSRLIYVGGTLRSWIVSFQLMLISLRYSPLFGTGLGSTIIIYEKFVCYVLEELCSDADILIHNKYGTSLLFRLITEFGLFGTLTLFTTYFVLFSAWFKDAYKSFIQLLSILFNNILSISANCSEKKNLLVHFPFLVILLVHLTRKEAYMTTYLALALSYSLYNSYPVKSTVQSPLI